MKSHEEGNQNQEGICTSFEGLIGFYSFHVSR